MELNHPNSTLPDTASLPPRPCCVRLCSKSMMYRPDERPGLLHFSSTQVYWCNLTMDPLGADGADANPKLCQPGRSCYRDEE